MMILDDDDSYTYREVGCFGGMGLDINIYRICYKHFQLLTNDPQVVAESVEDDPSSSVSLSAVR